MQRKAISAAVGLLMILASAGVSQAAIKVTRKPATVQYHYFDPNNKPADMPQLHRGEAALCRGDFGVSAQLSYAPTARRQAGGGFIGVVAVHDVNVELTLKNDIWLPKNASERLKQHEEGHRQISEMVYDRIGEKAARNAADKLDGRRFQGEGETAKAAHEAANAALTAAHSAMIQEYLDQTSRAGQKVQELYDEITAHGTKLKVKEADAIAQAFEQKPPPLWAGAATQPATGESSPAEKPRAPEKAAPGRPIDRKNPAAATRP